MHVSLHIHCDLRRRNFKRWPKYTQRKARLDESSNFKLHDHAKGNPRIWFYGLQAIPPPPHTSSLDLKRK
eukprot:3410290-Amphidinium_carterae.1